MSLKKLYWIQFFAGLVGGFFVIILPYVYDRWGDIVARAVLTLNGILPQFFPFQFYIPLLLFVVPFFVIALILPWSLEKMKMENSLSFILCSLFYFALGVLPTLAFWTFAIFAAFSRGPNL